MLTGTVISSDMNMPHKYSLQRISWSQPEKQHWNPAKTTPSLHTVDQNLCAIWHLVESMKISSSGVKGQHKRSTKVSKQRHHDNLNLHSAKDQCTCCRLLTGIQNSSCPFLFSDSGARGGEQQQVMQFKKSESSSTVVDLKGHFATYLCLVKYLQPSHISTESRTLFAPFDAVWCQLRWESSKSFFFFFKKSTSLKMARHCFQIL